MTQEIKRPAQFLPFSLTPTLSPMTPVDSSYERPSISAKLSSIRKPFFSLGYSSSPSSSSSLKNRQTPSIPSSPASGVFPSRTTSPPSHSVERPAVSKTSKTVFNVQFLPSEEYRPESKSGCLPRTPYPLTREEDEWIFQSFLTALNEEE